MNELRLLDLADMTWTFLAYFISKFIILYLAWDIEGIQFLSINGGLDKSYEPNEGHESITTYYKESRGAMMNRCKKTVTLIC